MDIDVIRIFIEVNARLYRSVKKSKGVNHQNTVGNGKIVNAIDAWLYRLANLFPAFLPKEHQENGRPESYVFQSKVAKGKLNTPGNLAEAKYLCLSIPPVRRSD